jgi:hypothetical protein
VNQFHFVLASKVYRAWAFWIATFICLVLATGWYLADWIFAPAPTTPLRISSAFILLVGSLFAILIHEAAHLRFSLGDPRADRMSELFPTGSMPSGYVYPGRPRFELFHALVGPTVSFVAGLVIALTANFVLDSGAFARVILILGYTHIAYGIINLLPASPFDGGRILRSVIWFLNDDHPAGTLFAFVYSLFVAILAIGFGLFALGFTTDYALVGLWCMFTGGLIIHGARLELLRSRMTHRAASASAADAVEGLTPTIRAAAPVTEAVDILLEQRANGPGLVRDRNRFVGVITLDEIREIDRNLWFAIDVRSVMRSFDLFESSEPGSSLLDVITILDSRPDSIVVVLDRNSEVIGLVNRDVSPRTLLRRAEQRKISSQPARTRPG